MTTSDIEREKIVDGLMEFDVPDGSMVGGYRYDFYKAADYVIAYAQRLANEQERKGLAEYSLVVSGLVRGLKDRTEFMEYTKKYLAQLEQKESR